MSVTPNERQRILDENLRLIEATWTCFRKLFPTMFACWKELVRRLDEIVESCDHCGEKLEISEARFAICAHCHKKNWITADTMLEDIVRPDIWLALLFFIENGVPISSNRLAGLLRASPSSVRSAFLKITYALESMMEQNSFAVHTAQMNRAYARRSLDTAAWLHPVTEQEAIERRALQAEEKNGVVESINSGVDLPPAGNQRYKEGAGDVDLTQAEELAPEIRRLETPEHSSEDVQILELLSAASLSTDELCALTGLDGGLINARLTILEISGLIKSLPGNRFTSSVKKENARTDVSRIAGGDIEQFLDYTNVFWHGISRKYVQLYMTAFWLQNAVKNLPQHAVSNKWVSYGSVDALELRMYVSPLVTIMGKLLNPADGWRRQS